MDSVEVSSLLPCPKFDSFAILCITLIIETFLYFQISSFSYEFDTTNEKNRYLKQRIDIIV